jgi:hypothetical protein
MCSHGLAVGSLDFIQALERRVWLVAWSAAAELPTLSLENALELTLLTLDKEQLRYANVAERWTERFTAEARLHPTESALAAAALDALRGPGAYAGMVALDRLTQEHQLDPVASSFTAEWKGDDARGERGRHARGGGAPAPPQTAPL